MYIKETQIAIKLIKDQFQDLLSERLKLLRVSAPLFVRPSSGLNDNLSGVEKPVSFDLHNYNESVEIVQSLAKWKRLALKRYGIPVHQGIYTDMNAIRPFEEMDEIHSIYVDQWDWERVILNEDRNEHFLKGIVKLIYSVFLDTQKLINNRYPFLSNKLPESIYFITSQELENMYGNKSPKEREYLICKEKKAVFLMKIGKRLESGISHDGRSPDYDDWELNGDILFWNPTLNSVIELSSMGIRVNKESLIKQLELTQCTDRLSLNYHKMLLENALPLSIGGGIGQSRICMYFLEKKHIGEVQASVWTQDIIDDCEQQGIMLL